MKISLGMKNIITENFTNETVEFFSIVPDWYICSITEHYIVL
jgi:hypothetical protein